MQHVKVFISWENKLHFCLPLTAAGWQNARSFQKTETGRRTQKEKVCWIKCYTTSGIKMRKIMYFSTYWSWSLTYHSAPIFILHYSASIFSAYRIEEIHRQLHDMMQYQEQLRLARNKANNILNTCQYKVTHCSVVWIQLQAQCALLWEWFLRLGKKYIPFIHCSQTNYCSPPSVGPLGSDYLKGSVSQKGMFSTATALGSPNHGAWVFLRTWEQWPSQKGPDC